MFREEVAQHYRDKGYRLHENVKVRGQSGTVHACDMVAQGPLGNLFIEFGDEGGFEGPELHAVRRAARDVGATPVVAAETISDSLRQVAMRASVVILDRTALTAPEAKMPEPSRDPDYPPWPDPGADKQPQAWPSAKRREPVRLEPRDIDDMVEEALRPTPEPTRKVDPGIWQYGRQGGPDPAVGVQAQGAETVAREATLEAEDRAFAWLPKGQQTVTDATPVLREPEARREAVLALRVVLLVLLAGAAAGAAFFGLQSLF